MKSKLASIIPFILISAIGLSQSNNPNFALNQEKLKQLDYHLVHGEHDDEKAFKLLTETFNLEYVPFNMHSDEYKKQFTDHWDSLYTEINIWGGNFNFETGDYSLEPLLIIAIQNSRYSFITKLLNSFDLNINYSFYSSVYNNNLTVLDYLDYAIKEYPQFYLKEKHQLNELLVRKGAKRCEEIPECAAQRMYNNEVIQLFTDNTIYTKEEVMSVDSYRFPPLHLAAYLNSETVTSALIDYGEDMNRKNLQEEQPIHLASLNGSLKTMKLLVSLGANIYASNQLKEQPIHMAAWSGKQEPMQFLFLKGADIHAKSYDGYQPIHYAARSNNTAAINFLSSKGVNLKTKNNNGKQPIHEAAEFGSIEVIQYLISKGINIHAKDNKDFEALYIAADIQKDINLVKYLLTVGNYDKNTIQIAQRLFESSIIGGSMGVSIYYMDKPEIKEMWDYYLK